MLKQAVWDTEMCCHSEFVFLPLKVVNQTAYKWCHVTLNWPQDSHLVLKNP